MNTISENVRKRVEQANNPALAMLSTKNNTTMAFSSNAPRFSAKQADESETFLGPGYYEQKSCFSQDKSRTGQASKQRTCIPAANVPHGGPKAAANVQGLGVGSVNTKSQHFMSNAGRFGSPDKKEPTGVTPGPGHYSQENLQRWFKRSYNMNFSEV